MTDYDDLDDVYDDPDDLDVGTTIDEPSPYDNEILKVTGDDDTIDISIDEITTLHHRVEGMERTDNGQQISFTGNPCPSNHGCSGAASCDSCYDNYPY